MTLNNWKTNKKVPNQNLQIYNNIKNIENKKVTYLSPADE